MTKLIYAESRYINYGHLPPALRAELQLKREQYRGHPVNLFCDSDWTTGESDIDTDDTESTDNSEDQPDQ